MSENRVIRWVKSQVIIAALLKYISKEKKVATVETTELKLILKKIYVKQKIKQKIKWPTIREKSIRFSLA